MPKMFRDTSYCKLSQPVCFRQSQTYQNFEVELLSFKNLWHLGQVIPLTMIIAIVSFIFFTITVDHLELSMIKPPVPPSKMR